jgi:hypothetical protein
MVNFGEFAIPSTLEFRLVESTITGSVIIPGGSFKPWGSALGFYGYQYLGSLIFWKLI